MRVREILRVNQMTRHDQSEAFLAKVKVDLQRIGGLHQLSKRIFQLATASLYYTMALLPDGKILGGVNRFNPDGTLNETFAGCAYTQASGLAAKSRWDFRHDI